MDAKGSDVGMYARYFAGMLEPGRLPGSRPVWRPCSSSAARTEELLEHTRVARRTRSCRAAN